MIRAVDGPLVSVYGVRPEAVSYNEKAEVLQYVWIAARSSLREVFERVSLADLASGQPPRRRHVAHRRRGRLAAALTVGEGLARRAARATRRGAIPGSALRADRSTLDLGTCGPVAGAVTTLDTTARGLRTGSPVVDAVAGGITSTMLALTTAGGDRAVLRLMTNEPWRTHGAELTTREHETQLMLADTDVPAPRLDRPGRRRVAPARPRT